MFLVGLISWWYGRGWRRQWRLIASRFQGTLAFFSVGQLLSTLFAPFRQISATNSGDGSVGASVQGFFDKLLSRFIGSIVRFMTILVGLVAIVLQAIYETIIVVMWWLLPLFPVAGLVLFALGWVPAWK